MNRERVVKIIQEWLPMTHRTVYELADRIVAEEEPYSDTHNDCHLDNVDKMEDNLKEEPQQPKLPEKLPEDLMEVDRYGLYKKTINSILDYLKAREI